MKTLNVCFITDENYSMPTQVAVESLIENQNKKTFCNIYIIAVNLSNNRVRQFKKLTTHNCKVYIKATDNIYGNINTSHPHVSKAAMLKFNLPNMFPDLDKILYMDGDILVLGDLSELYNMQITDKYAAVIPDMAGMLLEKHHVKFGFSKYFNSGIMLLNLKKMRNDKIPEKLLDYKLNKDTGHFMDQDCLNYVFNQNVIYVSPKYNYMAGNQTSFTDNEIQTFYNIESDDLNNIKQRPTVLHLTNRNKPWNSDDAFGAGLWQQYYKSTQIKTANVFQRLIQHLQPNFDTSAKIKGNFLLTKEKLPNGRRHIYICGIKVASYKKKAANQPVIQNIINAPTQNMIDAVLDSVLLSDGFDAWQQAYLWHYFMSRNAKHSENNQNLWLVMITMLILSKSSEAASCLLHAYINRFGIENICNYGVICDFANKQINQPGIDESAQFFKDICSLRKKQRFEKLIQKAKSIAIVGRSPCISGMGKGKEIDSHDIVIRFNNSDISGKYQQDYGKKMDINFINCWLDNQHDDNSLCVYKDYHVFNTNPDIACKIKQDLKNNIDVLDFGLKHWVCELSGLDEPTSGAIAILWVYKILGSLKNVDIYGFAFQDKQHSLGHFDSEHQINTDNHNMNAEISFLEKFVKQHKK